MLEPDIEGDDDQESTGVLELDQEGAEEEQIINIEDEQDDEQTEKCHPTNDHRGIQTRSMTQWLEPGVRTRSMTTGPDRGSRLMGTQNVVIGSNQGPLAGYQYFQSEESNDWEEENKITLLKSGTEQSNCQKSLNFLSDTETLISDQTNQIALTQYGLRAGIK